MTPSHPRARGLVTSGALSLAALGALTATGSAQTAPATATTAASPKITAKLAKKHVRYGDEAVVTGRVTGAPAGTRVVLQHRPSGDAWKQVARSTPSSDGRYRVSGKVRRNGAVRVVLGSPDGQALRASSAAAQAVTSPDLRLRVAAKMRTTSVRRHVNAGRSSVIRGRVYPAKAGRVVRMQVRRGKRWTTVDRDRTSKSGAYRVAWKTSRPMRATVRVRVSDDHGTTATRRTLGRVNVYRSGHASWYGPGFYGRRTACGQTLGYGTVGVAHKSLPCGTKVTFRYRGRTATIRVIDRGPFIAGREWDLTGAAKRRLGFGSTGTVRTTI